MSFLHTHHDGGVFEFDGGFAFLPPAWFARQPAWELARVAERAWTPDGFCFKSRTYHVAPNLIPRILDKASTLASI